MLPMQWLSVELVFSIQIVYELSEPENHSDNVWGKVLKILILYRVLTLPLLLAGWKILILDIPPADWLLLQLPNAVQADSRNSGHLHAKA